MARHAVVVGDGVAAAAAVRGLRTANWDVSRMRAPGAYAKDTELWISIWQNGVSALQALGATLPTNSTPFLEATFRDGSGADVARVALEQTAPGTYLVDRRELLAQVEDGNPSFLSECFWTAFEHPHAVVVHDVKGNTVECDLLVGADGIHGPVRQLLHGTTQPRSANQHVVCGSLAPSGPLRRDVDRFIPVGTALSTADERTLFVGLRVRPDHLFFYCAALASFGTWPDKVGGQRELLSARFADFHQPIPEIMGHAEFQPFSRYIEDLPPGSAYARGRLVLVGDAAHAMTPDLGQGCNQSLEDAVVLAQCLGPGDASGRWGDVASSLRTYRSRREPRAGVITEVSHLLAKATLPGTPLGAAARDMLLRIGRPFHASSVRWVLFGGPTMAS